jgi:hypothetical protein
VSPIAGSWSDAFENEVLKIITGQATSIVTTTPLTVYLALFTGTLSGDTPGSEATGGGYGRVSTSGKWGAPSGGVVLNNAIISLAQFSGSVSAGGAFTHFGLFDASSGGNALCYGDLSDTSKTGGNGDTISFAVGALSLAQT